MDGAELPKIASDAADRGVAAKVGENIAGVAGETAKSIRKKIADWIVERLGAILTGSSGLLLAILAYFHRYLLRQIVAPLWEPLLWFGLSGAVFGSVGSFWVTRRRLREMHERVSGDLRRQLDAVRQELDQTRAELLEKTRDADTDSITGIPNSRAYQKRLPAEFEKARQSKKPLTLIVIDLDNFKDVNDKSPSLGDSVLREFATELRKQCRGTDEVFRYKPGDEFLVLAPETPAYPGGHGFANRLRNKFKEYEYRDVSDTYFRVYFSAGVADAEPAANPADTPERLVARAEAALRRAKTHKNTFELYDAALDEPREISRPGEPAK